MKLVNSLAALTVFSALVCASPTKSVALQDAHSLVRRSRAPPDMKDSTSKPKKNKPPPTETPEQFKEEVCTFLSNADYMGVPTYQFVDKSFNGLSIDEAYDQISDQCYTFLLKNAPNTQYMDGPFFDKYHVFSKSGQFTYGSILPFSSQNQLFVSCEAWHITSVEFYSSKTDPSKLRSMVVFPYGRGTLTRRFLKEVLKVEPGNEIIYASTPCPQ